MIARANTSRGLVVGLAVSVAWSVGVSCFDNASLGSVNGRAGGSGGQAAGFDSSNSTDAADADVPDRYRNDVEGRVREAGPLDDGSGGFGGLGGSGGAAGEGDSGEDSAQESGTETGPDSECIPWGQGGCGKETDCCNSDLAMCYPLFSYCCGKSGAPCESMSACCNGACGMQRCL